MTFKKAKKVTKYLVYLFYFYILSILHWDSNSQLSDYESPPLTTRPGLPPTFLRKFVAKNFEQLPNLVKLIELDNKHVLLVHCFILNSAVKNK